MKVLTIDIETTPNLAWVWGMWQQDVPISMLEIPTQMLCFAAKWLDEPHTSFYNDVTMVQHAWDLLDEADVVIHYNGKRFDTLHLNREFKENGLGPPSPFKQIDLFETVKRRFKLPSNKLQYVATWLGLPGKKDTGGFDLWTKCMAGDEKAWSKMKKYNVQDVRLTEQVYHKLLPWIPGHPSLRLYDTKSGCPTCGSTNMQKRGYSYTKVSRYQQFHCNDCKSWFRDTSRNLGVSMTESAL